MPRRNHLTEKDRLAFLNRRRRLQLDDRGKCITCGQDKEQLFLPRCNKCGLANRDRERLRKKSNVISGRYRFRRSKYEI